MGESIRSNSQILPPGLPQTWLARSLTFLLLLTWDPEFTMAAANLRLDEAAREAITSSPNLRLAESRLREAELLKKQRIAGLLPSLDISGEALTQKTSPAQSASVESTLSHTVFDNGNAITRWQGARVGENLAQETYLVARENFAKSLVELYLTATLLQATRTIQKEQLSTFEYQFTVIDRLFRQGMKTALEQSRIKAQLLRAKSQLLETERLLIQNENQIAEIIGKQPGEITPVALDLDLLEGKKLSKDTAPTPDALAHPWFRISALTSESQDLDLKILERERWPKVQLDWSIAYLKDGLWKSATSSASGANWSLSLQSSWNVWDFGNRRFQVLQAREQNIQALEGIRTSLLALQQRADSLARETPLIRAARDLEAEVEEVEVKNYSYLESQYREGKIPFLDLVTALRDRSEAKIRRVRARIRDLQITIEHQSIEGKLYDWIQNSHRKTS